MAIKIKAGMSPTFGRITMPKGTYLSNPSTAADGGLGGGGTTPPKGMRPVGQPPVPQIGVGSFKGFLTNLFSQNSQLAVAQNFFQNPSNPYGQSYDVPVPAELRPKADPRLTQLHGTFGQTIDLAKEKPTPTNAFKPITPNSPTNSLVGSDLITAPNQITQHQVQAMMGNMSPQEQAKLMALKGYALSPNYVAGVGQVWVKVAESAPSQNLSNANNYQNGQRVEGNPYSIGATLAPGEHVVTAGYKTEAGTTVGSGIGVTGGTTYTDKNGNTVAQYAVTYGGGKGDRWKYNISQDNEGNWVRTYYKTFSKARSRSALKKKQGRKEQQRANELALANQPAATTPAAQGNGYEQQLVTLRADYG